MQLTNRQQEWLCEAEEQFKSARWFISSYPKHLAPTSTWVNFKLKAIELCASKGLCFHETDLFFHIGRTYNICIEVDAELSKYLSQKPLPASIVANQAESSLN